jgi:hypothetical protein
VLGIEVPPLNGLTQVVIAVILIGVMLVRPEGIAGNRELSLRLPFRRGQTLHRAAERRE